MFDRIGIGQDFQRILAHLNTFQVEQPQQRTEEIIGVIDILSNSPQIVSTNRC